MHGPAQAWAALPAAAQDAVALLALLLPAAATGWAVNHGYRAGAMTRALLWRFRVTNLLFVVLIGLSVGLGIALLAQERALREGTARAAEPFDVIVAAPGDRIRMLLAAVYLRPADAPLLGGDVLARLQADPRIDLVAPIAFGDSFEGAPVVGTTAGFAEHLAGPLAAGRMFATPDEAVAGALAPVDFGTEFIPLHGHGDFTEDVHGGPGIVVVGRMAPTGSPWDRAILVPVENVWRVHGLADGHAPGHAGRIGPPFDPAAFPGAPAFLLHSKGLADLYAVRAAYDDGGTMAFFPGAVLAELHSVLGDVREAMSLMAVLTQVLVVAGVLAGLVALVRLFARRFALLRALGAPRRFILAVVWSYAATLIGLGCALGLAVGWAAAQLISRMVTARTDLHVAPALGPSELILVAGFFGLTSLMALLPALAAYRRDPVADLRHG